MRRPGPGMSLIKSSRIDNILPRPGAMFFVAAIWDLLFRFVVEEVPEAMLAGDCTMTIEHEQLRFERPEKLIDAGKFFSHRLSQPDVRPGAFDGPVKRWIVAVGLCVIALVRDADRLQRHQRLAPARIISINGNFRI